MEALNVEFIETKNGNFERHPESLTPRVFVKVIEPKYQTLELLASGSALTWPGLPTVRRLVGEDFWVITIETIDCLNIVHNVPQPQTLDPEVAQELEDAGLTVKDGEVVNVNFEN